MANQIKVKNETIHIGDTIKVAYKFKEGEKLKEQIFRGILIAIKGSHNNRMITVRKMTKSGVGVERIFPVDSPFLSSVAVVKKGNVRRAKLYFIRHIPESVIRQRVYRHQ